MNSEGSIWHRRLRMISAQQCFEAGNFVAREIDDRLIIEFEFAIGQRRAQLASPFYLRLVLAIELRCKKSEGIPPFRFS